MRTLISTVAVLLAHEAFGLGFQAEPSEPCWIAKCRSEQGLRWCRGTIDTDIIPILSLEDEHKLCKATGFQAAFDYGRKDGNGSYTVFCFSCPNFAWETNGVFSCKEPQSPKYNVDTIAQCKLPSPSAPPSAPPSAAAPPPPDHAPMTGGDHCFDKASTTACRFPSTSAQSCTPVLIADLVAGDLVLGRSGSTRIVAVQHKAIDTFADMLTFHATNGGSVSMTADHGLFVDGKLVAAAEAKIGSLLSTGAAIDRITKSEFAIINAVTADGTIVAGGVLAASNPLWIAALTVDAPIARTLMNAAISAAGDVDSVATGLVVVLGKFAVALALGLLPLVGGLALAFQVPTPLASKACGSKSKRA